MKAICVDLDNTLILFDEVLFFRQYFELLNEAFSDLAPDPAALRGQIGAAMRAVRGSSGGAPNSRVFLDTFCAELGAPSDVVTSRLDDFYAHAFPRIELPVSLVDGFDAFLTEARRRSLHVVLATNPVYPLRAVERRMSWAGLGAEQFDAITHLDNSSFVKPSVGYYRQICERLGLDPTDCVMVGNDRLNDMSARLVGMTTYLTVDAERLGFGTLSAVARARIDEDEIPPPHFEGPFSELFAALDRAEPRSPTT